MIEKSQTATNYHRRRWLLAATLLLLVAVISGLTWYAGQSARRASESAAKRGIAAFESGRFEEASHQLALAIEHDGMNADLLTKLAISRMELAGDNPQSRDAAIVLLERAIAADPDHNGARRALLLMYVKSGFDLEALEQTQYLLARNPRDVFTFRLQMQLLVKLGDFEGLLRAAQTAETFGGDDGEMGLEMRIARSVAYQGLGEPDKAYDWAQIAFAHSPLATRAILLWVDRAGRLDADVTEQIHILEQRCDEAPGDVRSVRAMAMVCHGLATHALARGNSEGATRWRVHGQARIDSFLDRHDVADADVVSLAQELDQYGRSGLVFTAMSEVLDSESPASRLSIWTLRGILLQRPAQVTTRIDELGLVPDGSNVDSTWAAMMAYCAQVSGDPAAADQWRKAVGTNDSPVAQMWVAMSLGEQVSQEMLFGVLEIAPQHPVAAMLLAERLIADGRGPEAEELLRDLATAWPGWSAPSILLSKLYLQSERLQAALAAAEQARNAEQGNLAAQLNQFEIVLGSIEVLSPEQAEHGLGLLEEFGTAIDEKAREPIRLQLELQRADDEQVLADIRRWADALPDDAALVNAVAARCMATGHPGLAINLWESLVQAQLADPDVRRRLIRQYLWFGRYNDARALAERMMVNPERDDLELAIRVSVALYDRSLSAAALDATSELRVSPAEAAFITGRLQQAAGDPQAAALAYERSIELGPDRVAVWRALLELHLQNGSSGWAEVLERAAAALPTERLFVELAQARPDPRAGEHARAMSRALREPANISIYCEVLSTPRNQITEQQMREWISSHPNVLGLAVLWMEMLAEQSELSSVVDDAYQLALSHRQEPEITRRAAALLLRAGAFDLALEAADLWRHHTTSNPMMSDIVRADLHLRLGDAVSAMSIAQPYEDLIQADANRARPIVILLCRCDLAQGNPDRAWQRVEPLLSTGWGWRQLITELAVSMAPSADIALNWLDQVLLYLPAGAAAERLELGKAYLRAYQRFEDPILRQRAITLLESLKNDPSYGEQAIAALKSA